MKASARGRHSGWTATSARSHWGPPGAYASTQGAKDGADELTVVAPDGADELTLVAPEYAGGRLDWSAFRLEEDVLLGATERREDVVSTTVPAPASYPGMPAPRLWEFEDSQVRFGAIDAGPEDLARLLMIEFASVYGNDWFVLPLELPIGTVCPLRSLVVTDTFGDRTLVRSATDVDGAGGEWSVFQPSLVPTGAAAPRGRANLLFLAPVLPQAQLESEPVEEVRLFRDEMANMVWAVERTIETPSGQPLDRFQEYERPRAAAPPPAPVAPAAQAQLHYRLASDVPDHWIPFVPEEQAAGESRLHRLSPAGASGPGAPLGRLLLPVAELALFEEEIPREGVRLVRTRQHARWIGGTTHLWTARRKRPGRGEGSSGLRFDAAEAFET
jgi:hypothetical protein